MTPGKAGIEGMFQSLFLWNSRPDSLLVAVGRLRRPVSILVFVELAPGHSIPPKSPDSPATVSILVFVELAPGPGHPLAA